jgi:hypothetical protein
MTSTNEKVSLRGGSNQITFRFFKMLLDPAIKTAESEENAVPIIKETVTRLIIERSTIRFRRKGSTSF